MKNIKKRLVFHFYISPDGVDTYTNRIHFQCLSMLPKVFDEALFVISIDDTNDINAIEELEMKLIDCNITNNIEFKIKENDFLRDAGTFYDEIICHLEDFDGLTFFGHNKGTTNIDAKHPETKKRTELWIMSMYFGNFYDIDSVDVQLTEERKLAYGTLLNEITDKTRLATEPYFTMGERCYFYCGTFFWVNGRTIAQYLKRNNIKINAITDRWYAENFFADNFPIEYCGSYGYLRVLNYYIVETGIDTMIDFVYQGIKDKFEEYCETVYDRI